MRRGGKAALRLQIAPATMDDGDGVGGIWISQELDHRGVHFASFQLVNSARISSREQRGRKAVRTLKP